MEKAPKYFNESLVAPCDMKLKTVQGGFEMSSSKTATPEERVAIFAQSKGQGSQTWIKTSTA